MNPKVPKADTRSDTAALKRLAVWVLSPVVGIAAARASGAMPAAPEGDKK